MWQPKRLPYNSLASLALLRARLILSASETRAISSVVERLLHTQEVAGSNPASRTTRELTRVIGRRKQTGCNSSTTRDGSATFPTRRLQRQRARKRKSMLARSKFSALTRCRDDVCCTLEKCATAHFLHTCPFELYRDALKRRWCRRDESSTLMTRSGCSAQGQRAKRSRDMCSRTDSNRAESV